MTPRTSRRSARTEPACALSPTTTAGRSTPSSGHTRPTGAGSCSDSRITAASVSTRCARTARISAPSSAFRASDPGSSTGAPAHDTTTTTKRTTMRTAHASAESATPGPCGRDHRPPASETAAAPYRALHRTTGAIAGAPKRRARRPMFALRSGSIRTRDPSRVLISSTTSRYLRDTLAASTVFGNQPVCRRVRTSSSVADNCLKIVVSPVRVRVLAITRTACSKAVAWLGAGRPEGISGRIDDEPADSRRSCSGAGAARLFSASTSSREARSSSGSTCIGLKPDRLRSRSLAATCSALSWCCPSRFLGCQGLRMSFDLQTEVAGKADPSSAA